MRYYLGGSLLVPAYRVSSGSFWVCIDHTRKSVGEGVKEAHSRCSLSDIAGARMRWETG